jgi:hypothetical protein
MPVMLAVGLYGMTLSGWSRLIVVLLPSAYGVTLLIAGANEYRKSHFQVTILFPIAAMIIHLAYASGFAWRKNPGATNASNNKGE